MQQSVLYFNPRPYVKNLQQQQQQQQQQHQHQSITPLKDESLRPASALDALHQQRNKKAIDVSEQDGEVNTIFTLSDEFVFMFSECQSPDVLQVLRDSWHHYSQWITAAHITWQTPEFVASSVQLKNRLGSCVVASAGSAVPLRETVLPSIDFAARSGMHDTGRAHPKSAAS
jgi:hypothetical protein